MKIYLDNAATTRADDAVIEEIAYCMRHAYANPSSLHSMGQAAAAKVENAREICAKTIGAKPHEIIFTSGGTESDNIALLGYARANRAKGTHIITTAIEHHGILNHCRQLEKEGFEVTYLMPDSDGMMNPEIFKQTIREDTILISVMHVINEIGTVQPIETIGQIARNKGIAFHSDAVQSFGKLEMNVKDMCVDMLSVSAHKMHGPKGIGFLYVRDGVKLIPVLYGGEQERMLRAGTINAPLIAGFGVAINVSYQNMSDRETAIARKRDRLISLILDTIENVRLNGSAAYRSAENANFFIRGIQTDALLYAMDMADVCISAGSACTAGSVEPSHVIKAIGRDQGGASIRFSLSKHTTDEEIERAADVLSAVVKKLRA